MKTQLRSHPPAPDPGEFERLLQLRDLAAYRAVSAISMVLDFFEALDYESAENMLAKARAEFREADERVNQFRTVMNVAKNAQPATSRTEKRRTA